MTEDTEYTWPRIQYAEIVVPAGAASVNIQQEGYMLSKTMLVDYLWMSEESLTVNGAMPPGPVAVGQHAMLLPQLTARWWIGDRQASSRRLLPPFQLLYNFAEAKRWNILTNILPVLPTGLVFPGNLVWRFLYPWRLIPGNGLTVDFSYILGNLAGALQYNTPAIDVLFYGVGVYSHHRRVFELQMPAINSVAGPLNGAFGESEFVTNQTSEPYDIDTVVLRTQSANWGNPIAPLNDVRQLNMLRYRLRPMIGEPFSEQPVPIAAYGMDVGPIHGIVYRPPGGPLLLEAGSAIGWEFASIAGQNTRVQVALVGRVVPTGF